MQVFVRSVLGLGRRRLSRAYGGAVPMGASCTDHGGTLLTVWAVRHLGLHRPGVDRFPPRALDLFVTVQRPCRRVLQIGVPALGILCELATLLNRLDRLDLRLRRDVVLKGAVPVLELWM
ncbi:hypothetical protein NITHO_4360003 [Nitrolancea hollandica Lb]|uniref:Uncharacterized protein n=1 Tax=Nitrolancea hollandica Lb TaxID=1129897 RepID=I4EK21_9BACT|nr:hypothetical protein NITHO_4360003 [Nitrolancea hollandica Lb]